MRRVSMFGLCLVAAFALAALVAASASAAEPEWGRCVKTRGGHYTNSNCTKEAAKSKTGKYKGKYEWKAGAPVGEECVAQKRGEYTNSSCTTKSAKAHKGKFEKIGPHFVGEGGTGVLNMGFDYCTKEGADKRLPKAQCEETGSSGNATVECKTEHATGEAVGSSEVTDVKVLFTGCETAGNPCNSAGLTAGDIETNQLKGRLGYIEKATHNVGVLLEPAAAGGKFAKFECPNLNIKEIAVGEGNPTEGSAYEETGPGVPTGNDGIISPITPVNTMTSSFTQNYTENGSGATEDENLPTHFEGGQRESLEATLEGAEGTQLLWNKAGEVISNTNHTEGPVEIKA